MQPRKPTKSSTPPVMAAPPARKPRRTREQQKIERTTELLDAAWVMFCKKGYESVTIDDVAEYAGYSRMPIYSLFGDKQNLFFELWRRKAMELMAGLVGGFAVGAPLRSNLEKLAQAIASPALTDKEGHGESLFFVIQTIALSRPVLAEKIVALSREIVQAFAKLISESTLAPGEKLRADPLVVAAHLVAHINGMATVQFQTRGAYDTKAQDMLAIFTAIAFKSRHG